MALVPFEVPVKPNDVVPLAGTVPLYGAFVTVIAEPDVLSVPFHSWLIV